MNTKERIDQSEFQRELLFKNRSIDRLFFESKITREQHLHIMDIMDYVSEKLGLGLGDTVGRQFFESEIYNIVPEKNGDYHFCESIAKCLYEEGQWPEVFEHLYGDLPKYAYLKNHE